MRFYGVTTFTNPLYAFYNYSKMGYAGAGENKTFTLEWDIQVKQFFLLHWAMQVIIFLLKWAMGVKNRYYIIGVFYAGKKSLI